MSVENFPTKTKSTGFFKARINNVEIFNSTMVDASMNDNHIQFQVIKSNEDFSGFSLEIHRDTPNKSQDFIPFGDMVYFHYHKADGNFVAESGTFHPTFSHDSEKYHMTFKLVFFNQGEIEGEFEINGLREPVSVKSS